MWARDLWRLWCYSLCRVPGNPHGDPPGKTKPPPPEPKPDKHPDSVVLSGSVTINGIPPVPPLPDDIKIHIPRNVTVHHVFENPLRIILEMAPPKLSRISLTLTSP